MPESTIEGYLQSVAYTKTGGDWSILNIQDTDGKVHKCCGIAPERTQGAYYKLVGQWKDDVFKGQKGNGKKALHFTKIELVVNNDERGIVSYLSTEAPGLGEKMARELYRIHGANTIPVLMNPDVSAASIKGLTLDKAERVAKWLVENQATSTIKTRLYGIGLKPALIHKLLLKFGNEAEKHIRKDCFELTEIPGVGWETVNNIADLLGIRKDDNGRIKAALVFTLEEQEQDGHSCCTVKQLIEDTSKRLGFYHDKIQEQIEFACQQGLMMRGGGHYDISYLSSQERFNDQPDSPKPDIDFDGVEEWGSESVTTSDGKRYTDTQFDDDYESNQGKSIGEEGEWDLPWKN